MLGTYLKKYRLDHNMTQRELSNLLGTSQMYYSLIETNKVKPGIKMIRKISEVLNIEVQIIRGLL